MTYPQPEPPRTPPDGRPAPTYGYGGPRPMQSLTGLSMAIRILLGVMIVVVLVNAFVRFDRAGLIDDAGDGRASFSAMLDADDRVLASLGLYVVGLIATGVVFIIWQFRHGKNAQALGARQGLGPGWAIGGWFIPCANYVLPAVQLFQSSKGSSRDRRGAGIVAAWGVLYGLGSVLISIGYFGQETDSQGNFVVESSDDYADIADADRIAGIAFLVLSVAAVATITMVAQLTRRQTAAWDGLYGQHAAAAPPSPQPQVGAQPSSPPPVPPPPGAQPSPPAPDPSNPPPTGWTPPGQVE